MRETPIAAYTSDSRFPVVVGNTRAWTPYLTMNLAKDLGKDFSLVETGAGVTPARGRPHPEGHRVRQRRPDRLPAIFVLDIASAGEA